jgi:nucleoside-diphosphate-sugar epimerase
LKKVLVTGANGFIGSALCRRLVDDGFSVCGAVRKGRANSLPSKIRVAEIDGIGADTDWTQALKDVEAVVHLAARVHRMKDRAADPFAVYQEVNVLGTEHLARSAVAAEVKRFIFLSSVKVNGEENTRAYRELDKPYPKDAYAISKLNAERRLEKITAESSLEVTILRPPLVYGPGVKANFLELIKFVEKQRPLPLRSVDNRRSFIYLENLVDCIVTCIKEPLAAGQTFLVSDGQDVSSPALIRMLGDALGVKPRLLPCPPLLLFIAGRLCGRAPTVDRLIGSLVVDISKIRTELEWRPPFAIQEGIQKTAEWYLEQGKTRLHNPKLP